MTRPKRIIGTLAHRTAILAYIVFALFPLYWLLKVSVTPNDLLYSEGVRLWPSRASIEHYLFVLEHSDFPRFFRNSVIVSGSTAFIVTILASCAGYALSRFAFRGKYWIVALMLLTQMFPLVMLVAPIFKMLSPLGLTNSLDRPHHRLCRLQRAVRDLPDAELLRRHPEGPGGGGDDRRRHPLPRLQPDHPAADAARHRRDPRLRLHRRVERAAVRADADLQQRGQHLPGRAARPSSRNSRSISGR